MFRRASAALPESPPAPPEPSAAHRGGADGSGERRGALERTRRAASRRAGLPLPPLPRRERGGGHRAGHAPPRLSLPGEPARGGALAAVAPADRDERPARPRPPRAAAAARRRR